MTAQLTEEETLASVDASMADHPSLAAALVAAQKEMPAVEKDGTNPHFKSSFTTLGKLIATVRPVLNRHGIAVTQLPSRDEQGKPTLITRLVHSGGDSMEETMPLILAKNDAQALGSALTYAKRYALAAALAIADQEDDDGNAATSGAEFVVANEQQRNTMRAALSWLMGDDEAAMEAEGKVLTQCGGELPAAVANSLIATIKAFKDSKGDGPDQRQVSTESTPPGDSDTAAQPAAEQTPAEGIESEIPADTRGLS